jgi:phage FluMu protein Com
MGIREIRKFALINLGLFLFFPLYGIAVVLLVGEENGPIIAAVCVPYIAYYLYRGYQSRDIRCPKCKFTFFRSGILFGNPMRCNHCGLSVVAKYEKQIQGHRSSRQG